MIAVMFERWLLVLWYLLWVVLLVILGLRLLQTHRRIRAARQRGLYPPADRNPTMEDVRRLATSDEEALAVLLYSEIQDVGDEEAQEAVAKLREMSTPPSAPQPNIPPPSNAC